MQQQEERMHEPEIDHGAETDIGTLDEVYALHANDLYTYVRYRVAGPEEAEDLTAEIFERAIRSWDSYDSRRGTLIAWLFGIAHHVVARHAGKQRVVALDPGDRTLDRRDPGPGPLERAVLSDEEQRVLGAMQTLPEREREALALRAISGLGNPEIARIMGLRTTHVAVIVHRARRALRALLTKEEHHDRS